MTIGGLVGVEVDALESDGNEALLGLFEELAYRELAVLNILLLHEAAFLEELVETAVGDILDHSLGEVCSLCLGGFLHNLASLCSIFFGNPALGDVRLDVVVGVEVVGVETRFSESCFNSLLNLLLLGLLYSYCDFLVDCGLGNILAAYGYGIHRSNLHADFAANLSVNIGEVEAYDSGEFVVEVVVGGGGGSLYYLVSADFSLFAGLARLLCHEVGNGDTVNGHCLELLCGLAAVGHCEVEKFLGEVYEAFVLGHKVGLAVESENGCEVAFVLREHATLCCLAVLTLGGNSLTLLCGGSLRRRPCRR